jgi:hypothetical protein
MQALVIVLILATCGGLVIPAVVKVRGAAARMSCANNFTAIGITLDSYHDTYGCYPPAAMPNANLPPEKRFSWLVDTLPFLEANDTFSRLAVDKGWDAEENRFAALFQGRTFHCPGYRGGAPDGPLWASHYVGIAGVGADAPELPSDDPRAGFFGNERKLSKNDLVRGGSATAVMTETSAAQGAWTAPGPPTVRGFDPATAHFGGNHPGGCWVLFADGSKRFVGPSISDAEWRRMAVLAAEAPDDGP